MSQPLKLCRACVAAAVLMGAVPAEAQFYGYGVPYGPDAYYDPTYGWPGYMGSGPAPAGAYGPIYGYDPHEEALFTPDGAVYRRCRPHKACDGPPDY